MSCMHVWLLATLHATSGRSFWRTPTTPLTRLLPFAAALPTVLCATFRVSWKERCRPAAPLVGTKWPAGLPSQTLLPWKKRRFHLYQPLVDLPFHVPQQTLHGFRPNQCTHGWYWRTAVGTVYRTRTHTGRSFRPPRLRLAAPRLGETMGDGRRGGLCSPLGMGKCLWRRKRMAG